MLDVAMSRLTLEETWAAALVKLGADCPAIIETPNAYSGLKIAAGEMSRAGTFNTCLLLLDSLPVCQQVSA